MRTRVVEARGWRITILERVARREHPMGVWAELAPEAFLVEGHGQRFALDLDGQPLDWQAVTHKIVK